MDQQPAVSAPGAWSMHRPPHSATGTQEEPIMRKIAFITAASLLLVATTANANSWSKPCTSAPESQWLTVQALQAKVEAQGFKVQKGKVKKACGEFYTLDKTGAEVELFVDPTNGTIIGKL
jgi:hypothetical protein